MRLGSERAGVVVGLVAFACFVAAPQKVRSDSIWVVPTALSLLLRGDLDLDEYRTTCERLPHGCSEINGHLVSDFPVAPALLTAVPLGAFELGLALVRPLAVRVPGLDRAVSRWERHRDAVGDLDLAFFDVTENLVASGCVALGVALFFLALRRSTQQGPAWLHWAAAATLALGTGAFSTASRVMWQHGPAMLCCCAALVLLTFAPTRAAALGLGAVLAAGYTCRPTMALLGVLVVALVGVTRPRQLPLVLGGGALVVGAFVALNQATLGMALPPYFVASRLEPLGPSVVEALGGNLISPSRGLLVFTPLALLAPLGARVPAREPFAARRLELTLLVWLAAHWLVISTFPHWWGGHAYGPRFWAETSPAVVWLAARALGAKPSRGLLGVAAALALTGIAIHTRGATSTRPWRWNDTPINVDDAPARLWDWSDPQFLRR